VTAGQTYYIGVNASGPNENNHNVLTGQSGATGTKNSQGPYVLTIDTAALPSPPWPDTRGHLASIVAGHGEVIGLTADNSLWVYNDATGWANTGGHGLSISVGTDAAGHEEAWVAAGDSGIWRYDYSPGFRRSASSSGTMAAAWARG